MPSIMTLQGPALTCLNCPPMLSGPLGAWDGLTPDQRNGILGVALAAVSGGIGYWLGRRRSGSTLSGLRMARGASRRRNRRRR
jgi:hypothetical protein